MAAPSSNRTVFVSTNLNTSLALSVSASDTVADVKKKILAEHPICFPKLGKIEIHGLNVKFRYRCYNLVDSLHITKALDDGFKADLYARHNRLYLDASTISEHSKKTSGNMLACLPFVGKFHKSKGKVYNC